MTDLSALPQEVRATDEVLRLRAAIDYACDLLAERTYGSSARSPGHNARLHLEAALAVTRPAQPPAASADSGAMRGAKSALADCVKHGELRGRDLTQIFNPTERRLIVAALSALPQETVFNGSEK